MSQDDRSKPEGTKPPAPTPGQATRKYQQVVVPDHALKSDTTGTSFLRTGTFPSLTDAPKQPPGFQKSLALAKLAGDHHLKTGGSWHHVDGNRIETTTGRKVEVIAGSYVAHRGPGNSPGPNFTSTWATNSYTQIGSLDLPIGWNPNVAPPVPLPAAGGDPPSVEDLSFGYDGSTTAPQASTPFLEGDQPGQPAPTGVVNSNSRLQAGDVATVTWAQRVLTYVGSTNRPVPLVYAETQAGTIKARNFAQTGDVVAWNHAPYGKYWQDSLATTILTTNEAKADITVTNTAPLISTLNTGLQNVTNIAPAMVTATVAGSVANLTVAGVIANISVGQQLVINIPEKWQFALTHGKIQTTYVAATAEATTVTGADSEMAAIRTWMGQVNTFLAQTNTDVTQINTNFAAVKTEIGNIYQSMRILHSLG